MSAACLRLPFPGSVVGKDGGWKPPVNACDEPVVADEPFDARDEPAAEVIDERADGEAVAVGRVELVLAAD